MLLMVLHLVAGDRVLVKNQSTASENGLYTAVGSGAGAASRDHNLILLQNYLVKWLLLIKVQLMMIKYFYVLQILTATLGSDQLLLQL